MVLVLAVDVEEIAERDLDLRQKGTVQVDVYMQGRVIGRVLDDHVTA